VTNEWLFVRKCLRLICALAFKINKDVALFVKLLQDERLNELKITGTIS